MNAPLPPALHRSPSRLTTKYALARGHVFMSGIQALVRLPCCSSSATPCRQGTPPAWSAGYRGSPPGRLRPRALEGQGTPAGAQHRVPARRQRGARRDRALGARRCWATPPAGSQKLTACSASGTARAGRGPLLRRLQACQPGWHHAWGGGDRGRRRRPRGQSSSAPHQSDHVFKRLRPAGVLPVQRAGDPRPCIHAFAMSRYAGLWAA